MQMDKEEQRLLSFIPAGIENPRPLKSLVKLTGWNQRKVRAAIYRLIVIHHQPIGAVYQRPGNGYFIITSEDERRAALGPLLSQAKMISLRANTIGKVKLGNGE